MFLFEDCIAFSHVCKKLELDEKRALDFPVGIKFPTKFFFRFGNFNLSRFSSNLLSRCCYHALAAEDNKAHGLCDPL